MGMSIVLTQRRGSRDRRQLEDIPQGSTANKGEGLEGQLDSLGLRLLCHSSSLWMKKMMVLVCQMPLKTLHALISSLHNCPRGRFYCKGGNGGKERGGELLRQTALY